ncbi:MAG: hypothetical protein JXA43_02775 [Candidatus Diapherotrites archaeon]|nr:hypothetical protein [Candidatus Diapherotrites archaeon]
MSNEIINKEPKPIELTAEELDELERDFNRVTKLLENALNVSEKTLQRKIDF